MRVLVVGDICEDVFHYVKCDRLCPEAPVPVVVVKNTKESYGMAGNVSRNLESLGCSVDLISNQERIRKVRYVDDNTNQMFIRVDDDKDVQRIRGIEDVNFKDYACVVISDYDKGFLSEEDIKKISEKHHVTFLDSKKYIGSWCEDITYIKINSFEYERTLHTIKGMDSILNKMIITAGSNGCTYKDKVYPVSKVDVKDLSGAGDSFLAGLVKKYITTRNIKDSIEFANHCATQVVQQRGVSTITR